MADPTSPEYGFGESNFVTRAVERVRSDAIRYLELNHRQLATDLIPHVAKAGVNTDHQVFAEVDGDLGLSMSFDKVGMKKMNTPVGEVTLPIMKGLHAGVPIEKMGGLGMKSGVALTLDGDLHSEGTKNLMVDVSCREQHAQWIIDLVTGRQWLINTPDNTRLLTAQQAATLDEEHRVDVSGTNLGYMGLEFMARALDALEKKPMT